MKKIFKSPWTWVAASGIVLFFLSGLALRGNALNAVSFGVFGWLFWVVAAALLYRFVIAPIFAFTRLPQWKSEAEQKLMSDSERLNFLETYAKQMLELQFVAGENYAQEEIGKIRSALNDGELSVRLQKLDDGISALRNRLSEHVREIVRKHMKYAAITVVVSQKGWLDSLAMFAIQIRLIIAISKALGQRPSWSFVFCCMIWVMMNSLFAAIFDGTNLVSSVSDEIGDILGVKTGSGFLARIPFIKTFANIGLQAGMAASSVYVTGELVRTRLLGDASKKDVKALLKLRFEGMKEGMKEAGSLVKDFFFGKEVAEGSAESDSAAQ